MKLESRSEKGLLAPDNCVIALIDHQPQMLLGATGFDPRTGPVERSRIRRLHTQGPGSHCRAELRLLRLLNGESIEF